MLLMINRKTVKKIKILHVCSFYYGSKLYKNLIEYLKKSGCEGTVFAPQAKFKEYDANEEFLVKEKIFNRLDKFFFKHKHKKFYDSLLKNVKIEDYNILHAHTLFSNGYVAYKLHKKFNIPYIVAVRNTDLNIFFKYFVHLRKMGIEILENASKIIFISKSYKHQIISKYIPSEKIKDIEEKSIVIPNGIDEYFFKNKKTGKLLKKKKLNLVYTGRVDKNKNLITTINCCEKILKNKYNVTLNVIGKIATSKYEEIIKKYDFVNYLGVQNKEKIVEIYKDMDIFVMPSKHETFGLTYVEAMTQGLPVIYTRNEGFDKFFEDGEVGYSIRYNDIQEMAEKIELIVKNYENISNNCIEKSGIFNWNDIALKYIKIYESII